MLAKLAEPQYSYLSSRASGMYCAGEIGRRLSEQDIGRNGRSQVGPLLPSCLHLAFRNVLADAVGV